MEPIRISGPSITSKEIEYVSDAVANAWYADANVYHDKFEHTFARYHNVSHAIALPSCTSAIHLALLALDIGPGDEVILPDITWIATAAPISYVGATPVFADIDPDTWCLSANSFEQLITPRTKAVIPVDLYGGMPDYHAIQRVAKAHDIAIIEDAAEAIGSEYSGQKAGSLGDIGVFSFHGSKTLTTGEGGMLITKDTAIKDRVLVLRDHGRQPGDTMFCNSEIAHKYKMSSMQAALGLAQIERIDELVSRKREIFAAYHKELANTPWLSINTQPPHTINTYWMVTVILDSHLAIEKDAVIHQLEERDISCRPFFNPLSSLPAYKATPQATQAATRNSTSYAISPFGINLPSGLDMDDAKVVHVCNALKQVVEELRPTQAGTSAQ